MASLLDPRMVATPENTYTPTRRDVGNLGGGLLSGLLGYPGDIQELARLGGNAAIGLLSKVNPVARQLGGLGGLLQARSGPTSEEVGASLGADPNTGAFMAGTIGAPDPQDVFRHGLLGMTLFHGTPHKFDKFDISKIGTGEGAQAFGHGLYFAENPGVARSYQANLTPDAEVLIGGKPVNEVDVYQLAADAGIDTVEGTFRAGRARDAVKRVGRHGDIDAAIQEIDALAPSLEGKFPREAQNLRDEKEFLEGIRGKIEVGPKEKGHLYEVDIDDEVIEKFLDWDAPLSEQPELQRVVDELGGPITRRVLQEKGGRDATAATFYASLAQDLGGQDKASAALNQAGIPGIRFFDGGSRNLKPGRNLVGIGKNKEGYAARVRMGVGGDVEVSPRFKTESEAKKWANEKLYEGATRNIVVFDPETSIKKVKRDGELVYEAGTD